MLCSPRGFCAGVVRAIDTVERALAIYGAPVYVRHEIVHNRYVVDSLKTKGAIFVEELAEIPDNTNAPVVFSAHGVPKSVPADARARNFFSLDATCPLVTKVHREAAIHFKRGREILLIGHSHHPEVVGTLGQLPVGAVTLIETAEDAKTFTPKDPDNLAFVTQTTLSIDDTAEIVALLKARFPNINGPHKEDICYATTNRQLAVKKVAPVVDALIVVGAPNSSNSQRLREVAEREGCPVSVLAQRASDLDWSRFEGIKSLGITAGASAPEVIVEEIMGAFAERYRIACGDGLGRGRERVLPAAAFAATRRRLRFFMAVYTDVAAEDLAEFLKGYDIGELLSYKGIAEGVENSNFLLHTSKGAFILTLYEKRVAVDDLPYFLSLMAHLAERGVRCPQPARNRKGEVYSELAGRPAAIINFLEGVWPRRPNAAHCTGVGEALAKMHLAGRDFPMFRKNPLSVEGWRPLFDLAAPRADSVAPGLHDFIARELDHLEACWPKDLPLGVIHADLFPDNVFFLGDKLSGLIDFPFSCNDILAYDVAICLNAWCFEPDHSFNVTKARALLNAYGRERQLSEAEQEALPLLARGAALRFLLTRLVDFLNVPPGALVKPKDPLEYVRKLRFHQNVASVRDYGLTQPGCVA